MSNTISNFFRKLTNLFSRKENVSRVQDNLVQEVKQTNAILSKKDKIQSILNVFETGSLKGNYAKVSIFADGPKNIRQITYGRSQTTEWGKLKTLIQKYIEMNGKYSTFFRPYVERIGKTSLVNDLAFINKLKAAGSDPIMIKTQDLFFDEYYWKPAYQFMQNNGFVLPLSALVIYDSYIHSGSIPVFLRNRFTELVPVKGGDEKKWIEQYLNVRQNWLANHSRPILRSTTYRTKNMLSAVKENNWNLDKPFYANGVVAQGMAQSKMIGIYID
jgi:chitosanase